MAARL